MSAINNTPEEAGFKTGDRLAVLVEVSNRWRPRLEQELSARGLMVIDGDSDCELPVHLIIVEGDRGRRMLETVHAIRERLPRTVVIGITGWWSDLEWTVRSEASAVLHVPISQRECQSVLSAVGAG